MGWPQSRIDAQQGAAIHQQIALRIGRQITGAGVGAGELIAASDQNLGPDLLLDPASLQVSDTTVRVRDWQYGAGAYSIVAVMPPELDQGRQIGTASKLRRGALVEVLVSAGSGSGLSDYLRFGIGVLAEVQATGPRMLTLTIYDLLYTLRSRPYPTLSGGLPQSQLFSTVAGTETTLSSGYTAGDSTLNLTSASAFQTFDGTGIARVTGDSGEVFYLTFTGKSGNQLTGVSSTGQLGTTAEDAASGNVAISSAYLSDHPLILVLNLLTSTGAASNGVYDVYPVEAGFGIDQSWIDLERIRSVKREILTPSSGSYVWTLAVDDPVDDGLLWLSGLLSESGAGLCIRQGLIAAWSAQSLASVDLPSFAITDADIDGPITVDWYDPEAKFSYNEVSVEPYNSANAQTSVLACTVLPVRDTISYDLSGVVRSNGAVVCAMLAGLLADWCHYPPEIVRLTLRGALWGLAVGDVGTLTSQRGVGRLRSTCAGYDQRSCMIVAYLPDPIAGTTTVTLAITPNAPSDDYAAN